MVLTPQRVSKLIDSAFAKTKQVRQARVRFMTQLVGRFYRSNPRFGDEASKASPINLLNSALSTLVPNLVFNGPKAQAKTDLMVYRDYADQLAGGITRVSERQNLKMTLRTLISDAILLAAFVKVGEAVGNQVVEFGDGTDVALTEPYIERVSPDDMILDPNARAWDEQAFVGNRYRADVDQLIEMGFGDADQLLKLAAERPTTTRDRAEDVQRVPGVDESDSRRYVDLAEIWIPSEKRVITVPYRTGSVSNEFINDVEYSGPPKGQYHMLGFSYVGDNLLPVAPAGIWYDLHILGNRVARKIARQAERNKRVLAYEDDAEEDVAAIADSNDGETVRVQNLDKLKEVEYGGVSEKAYEWMGWLKQAFNEQTGAIDNLAGAGENAPTLGQEQIVQANSTVRLGDMQNLVYDFVGQIMGDVGWYLHNDPLINLPLVRRVNGVEVQDYFTPDARVGEWYDYNITVVPYSMGRTDPNTAVRRKLEFATNVIPAAAQAMQILGPGFKIGAFLTRIAREVGIEDADEFLVTPEIVAWQQQQLLASQLTGDPGKANPSAPPMNAFAAAPGVNPGQPNPAAYGPTGGISPSTEQAQAQQLATQESQASTKALALARGSL